MITQEAIMTTQDVADRFYQLSKDNRWKEVQDELFAENAASIEPPGSESQGLQNVQGLDAIKKKGEMFQTMIEETYGGYCSEPVVGGRFFSVAMGMDAKMKGTGRMQMDEIAVYEVKDGKIVKEEFFF